MASQYILGLSSIHGRLAVALVSGGRVLFAVEEDKLRRFRGLGLAQLGQTGSRAVEVALARVPDGIRSIGRVGYVPSIDATEDREREETGQITRFLTEHYGSAPPIETVDHVEAHLAFERAVHEGTDHVFMLGRSRAVYSAEAGGARQLDTCSSLVGDIERLAAFAGFPPARIHHLENMARFGEPRFAGPLGELRAGGLDPDPEGLAGALRDATGMSRRLGGTPVERAHYDYAASLYSLLKAGTIELLRSVPAGSREGKLAVCGGVFQSWTLNDAVAAALPESRILASFSPGNASGAIGAGLILADAPAHTPLGPYLGPGYTRQEVKQVLDNSKVRYALHSPADTRDRVCQALEDGLMVGWFEGRCEFGYRALGSRSVFASPANPYASDNLSSYLKQRPSYFAYAVALEENDPRIARIDSPYLSRSGMLKEYFDDSPVRIQSVSKARSPSLWQLLEAFRARTGVSALLNTSLNYFDEPIACTPRDALKTFYASGLDMLVIEDFILTKNDP